MIAYAVTPPLALTTLLPSCTFLCIPATFAAAAAARRASESQADRNADNSSLIQLWSAERALHHSLVDGYNKFMRPVKSPDDTVVVNIGLKLNHILDLQEKMQVLTTIVAVDQEWQDKSLQWNPDDFSGLNSTYLPCDQVWLPDIVLYNGVSNIQELPYMQSHVLVRHTGHVVWFPLVKLESACKLDVEFYPFDEQKCVLKFGSWSYSKLEVDVAPGHTGVEKHDYVDSGEFELVSLEVSRQENAYDCCPIPISTLNVNLHFRRRPLFALFTLALPCTMLSVMTTVAFVLPPESSTKMKVQLSVMLSLTVFMLIIGESMPPTSDTLPLLGIHVVIQMAVTAVSFVCSIVVLKTVKTDHKQMPRRVKHVTQLISKWLLVAAYPDDGPPKTARRMTRECKLLLNCAKALVQDLETALQLHSTPDPRSTSLASGTNCTGTARSAHSWHRNGSQSHVVRAHAACQHELDREVLRAHTRQFTERMAVEAELKGRRRDWTLLGLVIDRCLLWLLLTLDLCTSIYIYLFAPDQHLTRT